MSFVRDLAALLRLRGFRRLFAVRLLSQLSDGVFQVALATYVVFTPEQQRSATEIASAMAVLLLPYSLLGPFTGVLLDRWRRRQVLLYSNLLRSVVCVGTAVLLLGRMPLGLFYAAALLVTGVNRFVLAGLSASLPRVVEGGRLVMANAVSPTAGTIAATIGGGAAFVVHLFMVKGAGSDSVVVLIAAVLYLCAALAATRMAVDLLGPDPAEVTTKLLHALTGTLRGLVAGLRHLGERRPAADALAAMAAMRFCYGALTVTVLMLSRYAFGGGGSSTAGIGLLALAVAFSGAGFFTAALITPWATRKLGTAGWIVASAASAAVLVPALGLPFAPVPILAAAFVLGAATQGAKISTDTVVQAEVDDAFRGRVFSIYDMMFNVAFVGAAVVAALALPGNGKSPALVVGVAAGYAVTAVAYGLAIHRRPPLTPAVGAHQAF